MFIPIAKRSVTVNKCSTHPMRSRAKYVLFLAAALGALACGPAPTERATSATSDLVAPEARSGTRLRVVAANLTTGNQQSYDPGEGERILQALAPDVVLIQEFNFGDDSEATLRGFVDRTFDPSAGYVRDPSGQIPNGVISRYPIVASGSWRDTQTSTRAFTWARIDIPGDKDLWAVSLHLLTSSSSARQAEATAIVGQISANVPKTDLLVVGGDFNTGSRTEGCVRSLGAVLTVTGPFPTDASGNANTSRTRSKPYDWVLADPDLDAMKIPVTVGGVDFPNGLVFDSRVFNPIGAVAPVRSSDSGASNMQHMAVVRDFALAAVAPTN